MTTSPVPDWHGRAIAGIQVLQQWYQPASGLWATTGWWQSASALTALMRYEKYAGDTAYVGVASNTFAAAQKLHPGFTNMYYDDSGWWALAWIAAYDVTGNTVYLAMARSVFAHNAMAWDGTCGGGLWWSTQKTYKNAITSELFMLLAALLHERTPGDRMYLAWALRAWAWFRASGMIGPQRLVNDGLSTACENNGGTAWTYNQGVILGALCALARVTGDASYLDQAQGIADAVLTMMSPAGILAEPCESGTCSSDQAHFKGIFIRYLHELCLHSGCAAYESFIMVNASSVWNSAMNAAGQAGLCWAGPFDTADAGRQASACEALIAAAALSGELHA